MSSSSNKSGISRPIPQNFVEKPMEEDIKDILADRPSHKENASKDDVSSQIASLRSLQQEQFKWISHQITRIRSQNQEMRIQINDLKASTQESIKELDEKVETIFKKLAETEATKLKILLNKVEEMMEERNETEKKILDTWIGYHKEETIATKELNNRLSSTHNEMKKMTVQLTSILEKNQESIEIVTPYCVFCPRQGHHSIECRSFSNYMLRMERSRALGICIKCVGSASHVECPKQSIRCNICESIHDERASNHDPTFCPCRSPTLKRKIESAKGGLGGSRGAKRPASLLS